MDNLNKENFFNDLQKKYPLAMDKFCKWIDEYKKRVGWGKLFNENYHKTNAKRAANGEIYSMDFSAPKFHDLPIEMQAGIMARFVGEVAHEKFSEETVEEFKEEFIESLSEYNALLILQAK